MTITKTVLTQNCYGFKDKTYLQIKGLAMGTPTSSILSEIYLQYLENTKILSILTKPGIEGYFRYVDDILIIYNKNHIDIGEIIVFFNDLTPCLKFTLEQEKDNKLNFLDISLTKTGDKISYDIYRKPTTTDAVIPNDSCHPRKHKLAAIRYFLNRAYTYDLDTKSKQIEMDTIKQIIQNNGYEVSVLENVNCTNSRQKKDLCNKKWAKFTYVGKETRQIKFFRNTQVEVSYITSNRLGKLLQYNATGAKNKYDRSGIYQLSCTSSLPTHSFVVCKGTVLL